MPIRFSLNPAVERGPAFGERAERHLPAADIARALDELRGWPGYAPTPVRALSGLARAVGVDRIWYKDEGSRFGLGSFKPMGGGYAVACLLARRVAAATGREEVRTAELLSGRHGSITEAVTVTCATDGNHGRAVAWSARRFGARAVVYLARIVTDDVERAIAALGARTVRSAGHHDEAAIECREAARRHGWLVVSETENASEPRIARDTLAGYGALFEELAEALAEEDPPSHLFVQAGVGGLAAACAAGAARRWPERRPRLVVVEAECADSIRASLQGGVRKTVDGELRTSMAGLAAGAISGLAWGLLSRGADAALAIPDAAAEETVRLLAEGRHGGPAIEAGPSGAAGLAGALAALSSPEARETLGLGDASRIAVIGTEGPTDPATFRAITGRTRSGREPSGATPSGREPSGSEG